MCKSIICKYALCRIIESTQVSLLANTFPESCGLAPLRFCNVRKPITNHIPYSRLISRGENFEVFMDFALSSKF